MIGATILLVFIFAAFFAPYLAPMDPYDLTTVDLANFLLEPAWMETGMSAFPLGTDDQGSAASVVPRTHPADRVLQSLSPTSAMSPAIAWSR